MTKNPWYLIGADLHAVALCCLLQVVVVAPKHLAGLFHEKLEWIKVCSFTPKALANKSNRPFAASDHVVG